MKRYNGETEDPMNDDRSLSTHRERPAPRQAEQPPAGLGEVARDVVEHAQVIARDALAIAKLEARRSVDRAKDRVKDAAPRIAFGAAAGVAALVGVVFLLIASFIALGNAVPSVGWRLAIFGLLFLVVAAIAAIFAGSHEKRREVAPGRGFEVTPGRGAAETSRRQLADAPRSGVEAVPRRELAERAPASASRDTASLPAARH
ncbi:MAG: phage holin family protein [Byssovorax sp.]